MPTPRAPPERVGSGDKTTIVLSSLDKMRAMERDAGDGRETFGVASPKTNSREFVHVLENNLERDSLHTLIYIEDVSGGGPSCYILALKDCSICTMSGRKGR